MVTSDRRRWFRFSLRSLLVCTALLGLLLGWIAKERMQSQREREVAQRLEGQGWTVAFGGPFDDWLTYLPHEDQGEFRVWWRRLARQVLGPRILAVGTGNESVDSFSLLGELESLQVIRIINHRVRDITPLTGLRNLQEVEMYGLPVTREQIDALQKAVPTCKIEHGDAPR